MRSYLLLPVLASFASASPPTETGEKPILFFKNLRQVTAGSLHNIHVQFNDADFHGRLSIYHGACEALQPRQCHHRVGTTIIGQEEKPDRFVWITPEDVVRDGCLHAFAGSRLIGRSQPLAAMRSLKKRQSIADVADAEGPWFDGVAYMQSKTNDPTFVAQAKSKRIAIVGGGMSGLLTSILLDSVNMTNWHITEASQRVGGRVRTKYLAGSKPEDYQYQEMGPMRFPVSVKYAGTNETFEINDHKMVFQLADTVNKLNGNRTELAVNFIPWIQSSANTPANSRGARLSNGLIPSTAQIKTNASLANPAPAPPDATAVSASSDAVDDFLALGRDEIKLVSENMYKAHKEAVERGIFSFSETTYLRYQLNQTANVTDYVAGSAFTPLWDDWYDDNYFAATTWRTIDKGIEQLPRAILPLVKDRVTFGRKVEGLTYNAANDTISLNWRNDPLQQIPESESYDYAIVAAPFTKVRLWRTPPYSSALSRAISTMNYQPSSKVALHYKTRFWEHLDPPIVGGCGTTDIPGQGNICYPSYAINSTGPGVLLASYSSGTPARSLCALSEADHVGLVQRAVVEAHGQIAAEQYTGNYSRQCWEFDEHQAGAWAAPTLGQQELYLPAYYRTEFKTIFVGEHTSYTHAWIFSALDSAVRGTTQLLLDLGLVDEAKMVVEEWMGRWIDL